MKHSHKVLWLSLLLWFTSWIMFIQSALCCDFSVQSHWSSASHFTMITSHLPWLSAENNHWWFKFTVMMENTNLLFYKNNCLTIDPPFIHLFVSIHMSWYNCQFMFTLTSIIFIGWYPLNNHFCDTVDGSEILHHLGWLNHQINHGISHLSTGPGFLPSTYHPINLRPD